MKIRNLFVIYLTVALSQTSFGRQVKVDDTAPSFITKDVYGNTVNLEHYKGQKVLLSFFRYAGCPVCNFRIHELVTKHDSLKAAGYHVIAIFESDNATLKEYLKENEVPFTLIGNPDLSLYKLYNVKVSFNKMLKSTLDRQTSTAMKSGKHLFKGKKYKRDGKLARIPADFVIGEQGRIAIAYYGTTLSDHLPLTIILK